MRYLAVDTVIVSRYVAASFVIDTSGYVIGPKPEAG
jgi:hypothetical protein